MTARSTVAVPPTFPLSLPGANSLPKATPLRTRSGVEAPLDIVIAGRELAVHGLSPLSTVGELAALGGLRAAGAYLVDGRPSGAAVTLGHAGVRRGSVVGSLASSGELRRSRPVDDPAPSGDATSVVTGPGATPWTRTVSRPPRRPGPADERTLAPPTNEPSPTAIGGGTLLPALVPVVGAAVAAVVVRQPLWLLMSGLGLVAAAVTRGQQRWRHRRALRGHHASAAAARAAFAVAVADAHEAAYAAARAGSDLAAAVAAARRGSTRLWERRPGDADAYRVVLGRGDLPWTPSWATPADDADGLAALAGRARLLDVPVPFVLDPGTVLGIVGPLAVGRALARSIVCQLAVQHGPADVRVVAVAHGAAAWGWVHWLPHARAPADGRPLVASSEADADRLLVDLDPTAAAAGRGGTTSEPLLVLVVGDAVLAHARTSRVRAALTGKSGPAAGVVLAERVEQLPSWCTHVLAVEHDGMAALRQLRSHAEATTMCVVGADRATATVVARALAHYDDPEAATVAGLPSTVSLAELLGVEAFDPESIARAWRAGHGHGDPPPCAPVGWAADGVVEIDLERDGPHALVAGTTGAGKSELLRTWVGALALRCPPTAVTFVLVDYKGGAAFDACAQLPHVVGVVTDLDDALAERALVSLEAEVRRRERLLRAHGASDLAAYRRVARVAHVEPVPRLVVVVDEFAALAVELPGFLHALVDVARRGRSLGVHLVLATQRPGGAVSDDVRANTNLRIALRVQDATDSHDVIGDAAAARLPRDRPGRLVARFGPGELVVAQSACGSLARSSAVTIGATAARAAEIRAGMPPAPPRATLAPIDDHVVRTELHALVDAVAAAVALDGYAPPRRPWLAPLPERIELPGLPGGALGIVDDPAGQRQDRLAWDPAAGNLALVGCGAAAASVVLERVRSLSPAQQHVYVVDAAASPTLAPLGSLPHVGAIVRVDERERVERLLRHLRSELERRRAPVVAGAAAPPAVLLVVDGLAALRHALDDPRWPEPLDALDAIVAGGPALGVHVVATLDRASAVPLRTMAAFAQQWTAPDAHEGSPPTPTPTPTARRGAGRVLVGAGLWAQLAVPSSPEQVAAAVAAACELVATDQSAPARRPTAIRVLPRTVDTDSLPRPWAAEGAWHVPIGVGGDDFGPAVVVLRSGEGLVVAGPARSGRTSALRLLAHAHAALCPSGPAPVLVLPNGALRPSGPWRVVADDEIDDACGWSALVLVDDADRVDDDRGALAAIVRRPDVCVVAAGLGDGLRSLYGHWTQPLRRRRAGVLLRPFGDADGDVLGVTLPRRAAAPFPAGRGYLVGDGEVRLVQLALAAEARG